MLKLIPGFQLSNEWGTSVPNIFYPFLNLECLEIPATQEPKSYKQPYFWEPISLAFSSVNLIKVLPFAGLVFTVFEMLNDLNNT